MSSLNRAGKPEGGARLLIISKEVDESVILKQLFEQQGVETLVVSGTLEGLARLKMTAPSAVVVNQQQQELPGVLIARLIRTSPGYENMPIFLLSADDASMSEQASRAGVTQAFGTSAPKLEIVQSVIRQSNLGG
jgi:CheY-like chemotaxis protein